MVRVTLASAPALGVPDGRAAVLTAADLAQRVRASRLVLRPLTELPSALPPHVLSAPGARVTAAIWSEEVALL